MVPLTNHSFMPHANAYHELHSYSIPISHAKYTTMTPDHTLSNPGHTKTLTNASRLLLLLVKLFCYSCYFQARFQLAKFQRESPSIEANYHGTL